MIRLGDLVEAVLNEMAIARTKATLFGTQMAADFRDHEVLSELRIPVYRIGGAELSLPFVVATVSNGQGGFDQLEASDVAEAAARTTAALTVASTLREAFSVYEGQAKRWRREVDRAIAERFPADAADAASIDGMSAVYGYLVKTYYLLSLIQAKELPEEGVQAIVEAGYPDRVEETARALLKRELERISGVRAREQKTPTGEEEVGGKVVYVRVEAKELKEVERVSVLKLELEEGVLERAALTGEEEHTRG